MTQARRTLISLNDTPYYHCIARCVRRAFLCGEDRYSGQSFEHRRQWVLDRLRFLTDVFAIDVCAYAILHNHYHVVVHVDAVRAKKWSDDEVIERWCRLYKGNLLSARYQKGEALLESERDTLKKCIETWRECLISISWFMRLINETIAREANREDGCKGRFWEGRFKSQALLDTTALLACMAYVDLNPVRAGLADSLEGSDFTSIQERLFEVAQKSQKITQRKTQKTNRAGVEIKTKLLPFIEAEHINQQQSALPFNLKDYIALVDWTGRGIRGDKTGSIASDTPALLNQLHLSSQQWKLLALDIQQCALNALGALEQLEAYNATLNRRWMPRQHKLRMCYENVA